MSASWAYGAWGSLPWGGASLTPGVNPPLIIYKYPTPNSIDVLENAPVIVSFFDPDLDLNTATAQLYIDGILAYDGATGFQSGFTGRVTNLSGVLTVQAYPLIGWAYEATVTASASIQDSGGRSASATWSWKVRANPICYAGTAPLPIELAIQQPMTLFLELEPVRQELLNNVLKITSLVKNAGNKAARVAYQHAFSTELSTVQNQYRLKDKKALQTTVCERQNVLITDEALMKLRPRIQAGIESLFTLGALPEVYTTGFSDYLDSTLPAYRVSLVANMIILARSYEIAS